MIYSLVGSVGEILDDSLVIDVQGVGYQVMVPKSLLDRAVIGQDLKVLTFHYIREDQQSLYGFMSLSDRQLFMTLNTVSGLGPKVAIKILSECSSSDLIQAIVSDNIPALTQLPGVGKKLAERMVLELRDKLSKMSGIAVSTGGATGNPIALALLKDDIMMALKSLGYSSEEIRRAMTKLEGLTPDLSLEDGIKLVLSKI